MNEHIRTIVRGAYDIQKLRIMMGNRVCASFRVKLGIAPSTKEDDSDAETQNLMKQLRASYKKITDGVKKVTRKIKIPDGEIISDYTDLEMVKNYIELEEVESQHFKMLANALNDVPIWNHWLEDVKGIGPAMAGVLVSEIDITKARHASSLWKYAGLDVVGGEGRSRKKHHLVEVDYTDKDGKSATRKGITFNPFLKTKLMGVAASSFLKVGVDKSPYAKAYYDKRHMYENHKRWGTHNDGIKEPVIVQHPSRMPQGKGAEIESSKPITSKGRRHNMAMRFAVKMFLKDLYVNWRTLEGLPVTEPYSVAKLGRREHGT